MTGIALLVLLGFANWIATTILVESEVTRDWREWVDRRYNNADTKWQFNQDDKKLTRKRWLWFKLRYLTGCHLCTGTWVGLAMGAFVSSAIVNVPVVGWLLSALVIKGIGHFILVLHKAGESWTNLNNAAAETERATVLANQSLDLGDVARGRIPADFLNEGH